MRWDVRWNGIEDVMGKENEMGWEMGVEMGREMGLDGMG